ncbi:MAG: diguanylate cyclase, partial [Spirochaetia bacterium]|nr:diguanylate cyclase [Spirochaetia bacterium]
MSECSNKNEKIFSEQSSSGMDNETSKKERERNQFIEPLIRRAVGILIILTILINVSMELNEHTFEHLHYYSVVIHAVLFVIGINLFQSSFTGFCFLEKIFKKFHFKSELDEIKILNKINQKSADEKKSFLKTLDLMDEAVLELDADGRLLKATDAWYRICQGIKKVSEKSCCDGESIQEYVHPEDRKIIQNIFIKRDKSLTDSFVKQFRLVNEDETDSWVEGCFMGISSGEIRCILRDVSRHYAHNQELEFSETAANLSSIPGRSHSGEKIDQAVKRALRFENFFALLFIDIDHFSQFTEDNGQKAADSILDSAAQSMDENRKPSDALLRWGDDEFLMIISDFNYIDELKTHIMNLKKNLQKSLDEDFPGLRVSFSMGASFYSFDSSSSDHLI